MKTCEHQDKNPNYRPSVFGDICEYLCHIKDVNCLHYDGRGGCMKEGTKDA